MYTQNFGQGYYLSSVHLANNEYESVLDSEDTLELGEDYSEKSTAVEKELKCVVCDGYARGLHFGVTACAACGAFFRRAVSERRTYFCKNQKNCHIVHGLSKRKLCRYCRLKKCITKGMQPEKVQNKMRPLESVSLPPVVEMAEMNCAFNEYAVKYTIIQRQRMNRYLPHLPSHTMQFLNKPATMSNFLTIMETEPQLLSSFLNSLGVFKGFSDSDKMAVFKNYTISSRLAEQARIAGLLESTGNNRLFLLDGSYVEATESAIIEFYSSGKTETGPPVLMDASLMMRLSMPSGRFHLDKLVPAIQRLDLSDQEFAAFLNLALWDT
uniref:Nuclear receptor domain-containing protein n=1 Tax=Plectus sambesii TaxID=2011161 RepID=A0A914WY94_9BILA